MDNSINWDNNPLEDMSKSWEENCQDQLRNIHELNQFSFAIFDWLVEKTRCNNFATSCTCGACNMDGRHIL